MLVVLIFSLFQRKKTADGFFELNIRCFKQNRVQEKKKSSLNMEKRKKKTDRLLLTPTIKTEIMAENL